MEPAVFLEKQNVISLFRDVADGYRFTPLPEDWHIVVADVRNSTEAIRQGRYKEVNMAGAAAIVAVLNHYKYSFDLSYMFGGDGAVIAIPDRSVDIVKGKLAYCQNTIRRIYDLELAVGVISMKEIRDNGYDIRTAKLKLSEEIHQTVFWGKGIQYAEGRIKSDDFYSGLVNAIEADFTGLQCRWDHLPGEKDEIVNYIIQACSNDEEENTRIYNKCFQQLDRIYGNEDEYHPISISKLDFTRNSRLLGVEWKLQTEQPDMLHKIKYAFRIAAESLIGGFFMRQNINTSTMDWEAYKSDMRRHTDYRKFNDSLKFVITGTIAQRMKMTKFLEQLYAKGDAVFGVHPSSSVMITCFVENFDKQHIHFVDGADGGYTMASRELKKRRKALLQEK